MQHIVRQVEAHGPSGPSRPHGANDLIVMSCADLPKRDPLKLRFKRASGPASRSADYLARSGQEPIAAISRHAPSPTMHGTTANEFAGDLGSRRPYPVQGRNGDGTATLRTEGGAIQERYLAREAPLALEEWQRAMKIKTGPVFLAIKRHGSVDSNPITCAEVARTFERIARCIGLDVEAARSIGGHSTRIGAAQDITSAGAALPEIMAAGGSRSPGIPARYARKLDARRGAMRERLTRR